MRGLISELDRIGWASAEWRKEAADILCETQALRDDVASYMMAWETEERLAKLNGSHETSTHYKWLLYRDHYRRFTIWLHDYKNASNRRPGYAEVPHNHRYDLCSIVLQGGYDSVLYDVTQGVVPIGRGTFGAGSVLSLSHEQVHALEEILGGTQTLFVEGPVRKNFSTVYPINDEPRIFADFEGRWNDFIARLRPGTVVR